MRFTQYSWVPTMIHFASGTALLAQYIVYRGHSGTGRLAAGVPSDVPSGCTNRHMYSELGQEICISENSARHRHDLGLLGAVPLSAPSVCFLFFERAASPAPLVRLATVLLGLDVSPTEVGDSPLPEARPPVPSSSET